MRTLPSSLRLFSRNAISIRGGATTVLFSVCGRYFLAVRALNTDLETAGLRVTEIRAASDLEILLLTRRPCLNVAGLHLEVSQIAGAAFERAHRNIQRAEEVYRVLPHDVVPLRGFLRLADNDHFLLLELVDAVNAALLDAVCADLLAEARRIARQRLREALLRQDRVNELADHGVLGRTDQVEILALDLVHHVLHFREAHNALDHVGMDHVRRNEIRKTASDHEITRIGQHRGMQACHIAAEVVEAVAGGSAGCFLVDAGELLHDILVVRDLEIRYKRVAEALIFDIFGVVLTDRNGRVDDVRDDHHDLADLGLKLVLALSERLHLGVKLCLLLCNAGFCLLRTCDLAACDPLADLLAQRLSLGTELVALLLCLTGLLVQLDDLVYQRELLVLKLLLDIFLDNIGVGSQKFNIQHNSILPFIVSHEKQFIPPATADVPARGDRHHRRIPASACPCSSCTAP